MTRKSSLLISFVVLSLLAGFAHSANIDELKTKAEQGDADAQYMLGAAYAPTGGVVMRTSDKEKPMTKDLEEAAKWFLKAAQQGHALAQYRVGAAYDTGQGLPNNSAEAVKWYRKSADQGYEAAEQALGKMYQRGEGVPKDFNMAAKWYRKSAEQGNPMAQAALWELCEQGGCSQQNYSDSVVWLRKAAELDLVAKWQLNLAGLYAHGKGVPVNYTEAALWYKKAADWQLPEAQFALGSLYWEGKGVPQDYVMAYFWLNLATTQAPAQFRDKWAQLRDTVNAKMTPDQVAEAQRMAREWKPPHANPQSGKN